MKIVLHKTLNRFLHKSLLNYKKCKEVLFNFIVMKLKALFVAILLMASCKENSKITEVVKETTKEVAVNTSETNDVKLEIYDFAGFEQFLNKKDDKTYVVNFWATWCAPCVKELPYFEKLNSEYQSKNVEVILVSLDFPHMYDKKLKPFIKENALKSKVIVLEDPDMNSWIPKVDKGWSGSIPATVIYKNDTSRFYEQSFNYEELQQEVNQFLK
ncbi:AhpC/TSA family protein [Algibacter pectinivorans]|uniref:AhpC/TSA family protein n=2 Tax=Algibacter pectinivorans TaxID=870482 RepID=A0A1I1QCL1_9FLAO|nr:AhpC/TSA family protein [Algibacter pectinivorans]